MKDEPDIQAGAVGGKAGGGGALREALRRARAEAAERQDVMIDLRAAETGRLALLRDALEPVFASVPPEVDLFDIGLVGGERPRLFVDMVAFIEMARDRRTYRFLRDGRNGRAVIVESDRAEPVVEAVTAYVARRLVERERLLSDEDMLAAPMTPAAPRSEPTDPVEAPPKTEAAPAPALPPAQPPATGGGRWLQILAVLVAFGLGGGLGAAVIVALMVAAAKGFLPGVG